MFYGVLFFHKQGISIQLTSNPIYDIIILVLHIVYITKYLKGAYIQFNIIPNFIWCNIIEGQDEGLILDKTWCSHCVTPKTLKCPTCVHINWAFSTKVRFCVCLLCHFALEFRTMNCFKMPLASQNSLNWWLTNSPPLSIQTI
jgi:hypothetical protein